MPATTWKIIDEKNLNRGPQGPFRAAGKHANGEWNVAGTAYEDGIRAGVDVLALDNGKLRLDVVPTRGMGIHRVAVKGDQEVPTIGWKSPVRGPVHPSLVNLGEPSGLGWLDGFDEFLVRCGLESNGAPDFDSKTGRLTYPLHG